MTTPYHARYFRHDVEGRGSQSRVNIDGIRQPDRYKLRVERNGKTHLMNVDLMETFNRQLGLTFDVEDV